MLKSMTAYSRRTVSATAGRFTVEISSVNRKFLEINTFLPKGLMPFDVDIKQWIAKRIYRGQLNVRLSVCFNEGSIETVTPNLVQAAQIKNAWDAIAKRLDLPPSSFSLDLLANAENVLFYEERLANEEEIKTVLHSLFNEALEHLLKMKIVEGAALFEDIAKRLDLLKSLIDKIAEKAPNSVHRYREKLILSLKETVASLAINDQDERLMKEICLFSEKVDVEEEITRFRSHLVQFLSFIEKNEEGVGKTLEFIVQELNREINTIGAKSSDIDISYLVIEAKGEIERIREQIQNVE